MQNYGIFAIAHRPCEPTSMTSLYENIRLTPPPLTFCPAIAQLIADDIRTRTQNPFKFRTNLFHAFFYTVLLPMNMIQR